MSKFITETVTYVHHWNDSLFTIKTTRGDSLRFRNGEFAMIGIMVDGKPLARAYSIASPNWAKESSFSQSKFLMAHSLLAYSTSKSAMSYLSAKNQRARSY